MRLLSTMLAVPSWRRSLDLGSEEALSITAALLKQEAEALDHAADGERMTKVTLPSHVPPCKLSLPPLISPRAPARLPSSMSWICIPDTPFFWWGVRVWSIPPRVPLGSGVF